MPLEKRNTPDIPGLPLPQVVSGVNNLVEFDIFLALGEDPVGATASIRARCEQIRCEMELLRTSLPSGGENHILQELLNEVSTHVDAVREGLLTIIEFRRGHRSTRQLELATQQLSASYERAMMALREISNVSAVPVRFFDTPSERNRDGRCALLDGLFHRIVPPR